MKQFRLLDDHIRLLSCGVIDKRDGYSGLDVPGFDGKRPYGNSDVLADIHKIFTGETLNLDDKESENWFERNKDTYIEIHNQLDTALQIVLCTMSFEPGLYEANDYRWNWRKVSD